VVDFFIHRPVFASVIAVIMILTGLIAYNLLPVAQFPDITPPQVVVTTTYPGASSQIVANTVTTPLEQQINGVPGMAYMSSVSANDGSSNITITFNVGYPIDIAAVDVQNRVSQAAEHIAQSRLFEGRDRPKHFIGEIAAQDGTQLRHLAQCRQPVEPRHQRFVEARRDADLGQRARQRVVAPSAR